MLERGRGPKAHIVEISASLHGSLQRFHLIVQQHHEADATTKLRARQMGCGLDTKVYGFPYRLYGARTRALDEGVRETHTAVPHLMHRNLIGLGVRGAPKPMYGGNVLPLHG
jgi:hypothetical protein